MNEPIRTCKHGRARGVGISCSECFPQKSRMGVDEFLREHPEWRHGKPVEPDAPGTGSKHSGSARGHSEPEKPGGRARNKYGATKAEADGIRFDSKVERDYYVHLTHEDGVEQIDVHPSVTLPGGIRKSWDFLVWRTSYDESGVRGEYLEVKGREPGTDDKRMIALHRASHPVPLRIIQRRKGVWTDWEAK